MRGERKYEILFGFPHDNNKIEPFGNILDNHSVVSHVYLMGAESTQGDIRVVGQRKQKIETKQNIVNHSINATNFKLLIK